MSFIPNTFRHLYSDLIDWKEAKREQLSNWMDHQWSNCKERGILPGLAFSVITSIAAAILIAQPAPLLAGTLFGIVSYLVLTPITEELFQRTGFHKAIYPLGIVGSGVVGTLFLQTICKINVGLAAAIFLTAAAFVGGQAARLAIYGEPSPTLIN